MRLLKEKGNGIGQEPYPRTLAGMQIALGVAVALVAKSAIDQQIILDKARAEYARAHPNTYTPNQEVLEVTAILRGEKINQTRPVIASTTH